MYVTEVRYTTHVATHMFVIVLLCQKEIDANIMMLGTEMVAPADARLNLDD
jgi:hypothetical protein